MKTNFFELISGLGYEGNLIINIKKQETNNLIVSVLVANEKFKDKATGYIPPMVLTGTSQELNEGFFTSVTTPIEKTSQLFCNMLEHQKALDKTQKESKMERSKVEENKKNSEARKKKYDELMKKVSELEKQGKYGEAIGQLPDVKIYTEHADEIRKRAQELRSKHGSLSLFEQTETSVSPDTKEEEEENDEPEEDNDEDSDPIEPEEDDNDDEN